MFKKHVIQHVPGTLILVNQIVWNYRIDPNCGNLKVKIVKT